HQTARPAAAAAANSVEDLGARNTEEGHPRLAGHGAREEGLACPGRTDEEHAAGNAGAEGGEFLRILEELDDLDQLLLGFLHARHVGEGHRGAIRGEETRPAL